MKIKIKTALVSVSNKAGLEELVSCLIKHNININKWDNEKLNLVDKLPMDIESYYLKNLFLFIGSLENSLHS